MIISWLFSIWDLNFLLRWFKLLTNVINGRGACTCIVLTTDWDFQNLTFFRQSVIIMINLESTWTPITKETWRLLPETSNLSCWIWCFGLHIENFCRANRFWKLSIIWNILWCYECCWSKTENTKRTATSAFGYRQFWAISVPVNFGSNTKALGSNWFGAKMEPKWNRTSTEIRNMQITPFKPCTETLVTRTKNQNRGTRTIESVPYQH